MAKVYVGLGTNLGNKEENLRTAVYLINRKIGKVISLSSFYETAAWGFVSEHTFLNAAACIETTLSPTDILHFTQEIEREMGRKQKSVQGVYSDRPIDIDILLYDSRTYHSASLDDGTSLRDGTFGRNCSRFHSSCSSSVSFRTKQTLAH